jgi:hypothetical protein
MPSYHCYFLDDQHHIRGTEVVETALLSDAIDLSLSMLKERQHHMVELWEGATQRYSNGPARKSPSEPLQARNARTLPQNHVRSRIGHQVAAGGENSAARDC